MTRLVMLGIALSITALVIRRLVNRAVDGAIAEPDPMAQPFLDSRNTATYLYNRATGVRVSYN